MTRVTEHLATVRSRVANAATVANRTAESVNILAVSKRHSTAAIRDAAAAGHRAFGENYVDEAVAKIAELRALNLEWHYIGAIQSNKTRLIAAHFDWVHTVDRPKIAQRLSDQRSPDQPPINVCLQVNIDAESQKAGVDIDAVSDLAQLAGDLPGLCLRGLMCLPKAQPTPDQQREPFARLRRIFDQLQLEHPTLDTLSMGMSGDLEAAIAEGATWVRVGTAIFGQRD